MRIQKKLVILTSVILILALSISPVSLLAKTQDNINCFNMENVRPKESSVLKTDEVRNEARKTANYLKTYYEKNGIKPSDFKELILLIQSGLDCSNLVNQYMKQIKLETVYDYAGAILVLTLAGYDVTNYNNVNLIQDFETRLSTYTEKEISDDSIVNPYYLETITYAIYSYKSQYTNAQKLIGLVNAAAASYYEDDGEETAGFDYWGVSADNNGSILPALLPFCTYDYKINSIITNTVFWTSDQIESDGTILSWGVPSASSTGLALALFSAVGDDENALKVYRGLMTLKSSNEGAYLYENSDSVFSTKDAFRGLMAYLFFLEGKGSCFDVSQIIQQNLMSIAKGNVKNLEAVTINYNELKNTKISLHTNIKTLYLKTSKKTFNLTSKITGTSKKATFTSSNPKVASVDKITGKVSAKSTGSTIICASVNEKSVYCLIIVKNPTLVLKKSSIVLKKNTAYSMNATARPAAKITYRSQNKSIAKVSSAGKITAKKKGKTTIIVKANNIIKKFTVKVI